MATPMRAKDTAAGMTLGSSSRNRIREVVAPMARAATTNSRLAKDSVVARMTRKRAGEAGHGEHDGELRAASWAPEGLDDHDGQQGREGQDDEGHRR